MLRDLVVRCLMVDNNNRDPSIGSIGSSMDWHEGQSDPFVDTSRDNDGGEVSKGGLLLPKEAAEGSFRVIQGRVPLLW
jgi:hypothetical protein